MQLSLARWNDEDGESAGYWLVRELPGFAIERLASGWSVICADDYLRHQGPDSVRVWGEGWQPSYGLFYLIPAGLLGPHPTRSAALLALEGFVNRNPVSALPELL